MRNDSLYLNTIFYKERQPTEKQRLNGKIRLAVFADAEQLLRIYAPYIEHTSYTFEYDVPSLEDFCRRIEEISKKYPWIVYEEDGKILGYAYGGPLYTRAAYQWTVEDSIYVSPEAKGKGIGTLLLEKLLGILQKQGFCICYSLIVSDNLPSLKMHEKFGFTECGFAGNTGFKFGEWHSIVTLEKRLNEPLSPPKPIIPFPELKISFFDEEK